MSSYIEMVDAVNKAKTSDDHWRAQVRLMGWIQCAEHFGNKWSGIEADLHTLKQYGDRPMCCGVLMDWKPE